MTSWQPEHANYQEGRSNITRSLQIPFDRIRIINLPHRTDRRREMMAQLAKAGLLHDDRVEFFPAHAPGEEGLFYSKGAYGCFLSHRDLINAAAAAGESLLILEDDCDFTPLFHNYDWPPCDFLWGGIVSAHDPANLETSDIIGSHFIGLTAATVEKLGSYLDLYLLPAFRPDLRAASEPSYNSLKRPGIDGAYVWFRRANPAITTVFAELGVQRSSRTDVGRKKWFDELPIVRSAAQVARRLLK